MNILGIDIGTTTVTALVLNTDTKTAKSVTLKNDSFIDGRSFEKLQSPEIIMNTVKKAVKDVTDGVTVDSVGVTGQMHGILYLDKNNNPCSPLMIWQDGRGNEIYKDNITYAEYLTEETGIKSASG
ncbi:MAG: FGGY family carbohydrate kinase, partial [Acutalibacteraceae bacterium]